MEFPAHLIDETAGRLIMNGIFRSLADGFFQDKLLPFLYQRCSAGSPLASHCIVSRKRALRGVFPQCASVQQAESMITSVADISGEPGWATRAQAWTGHLSINMISNTEVNKSGKPLNPTYS